MEKLLVVCGPTATGKTKLALKIAKKFSGEILSADSRQVYKHLDIGTGKDIPLNAKCQISKVGTRGDQVCFYRIDGVKLWGYDLVSPEKEFSVAQYEKVAKEIIKNIWEREKLPILVGGTGLYIKVVIDGIETATIPKNMQLRESLGKRNSDELFETLSNIDPVKSASMNISDSKNPRRLVRAIEMAQFKLKNKNGKKGVALVSDLLFIGLTAPRKMLNLKIAKRVQKRVKQGIKKEVVKLLGMGVNWDMQSMNTFGYRQWRDYLVGKNTKDQVVDKWTRDENNYAKRQITWFKRDKRIKWFDISNQAYKEDIETEVKKWYSRSNKYQ